MLPRVRISSTSSAPQPAIALSRRVAARLGSSVRQRSALIPGQPGAQDLVVGIADAKAQQQSVVACLVGTFVAGEQQLADTIKWVALAAPAQLSRHH